LYQVTGKAISRLRRTPILSSRSITASLGKLSIVFEKKLSTAKVRAVLALEKPAAPQTAASAFYHLNFVVQELANERVINSRSYSMIMSEAEQSSIRAGEKVPFSSTSGPNTQWQQIDVGVNIKLSQTGNHGYWRFSQRKGRH
jgi:hypothetical protein